MKAILLTIAMLGSVAHGADKIFVVDGKVVEAKAAFKAADAGKKVLRCSEARDAVFIDAKGNQLPTAFKCSEVTLYTNKSGLPTWKSATTGTKW